LWRVSPDQFCLTDTTRHMIVDDDDQRGVAVRCQLVCGMVGPVVIGDTVLCQQRGVTDEHPVTIDAGDDALAWHWCDIVGKIFRGHLMFLCRCNNWRRQRMLRSSFSGCGPTQHVGAIRHWI